MVKHPTRFSDKDDDEDDVKTKPSTRFEDDDEVKTKAHKGKSGEVEPLLSSDVAPSFTPGPGVPAGAVSAIKTDTPAYGTETPPRQTPPTNVDSAMKHSPPSFYDANGAKIVSLAPTLTSISPATAVSVTGADLVVTATGTNFDRATFLTFGGALVSNTAYVSATSLTATLQPSKQPGPGVVQVTAKNPGGESVQKPFTFT